MAAPERRCVVTRRSQPRDRLVRFAVSPAGELVPDPGERLPGRGLWLTARGDIVRRACAENSFAKAARRRVAVPADLPERLVALLDRRCLDLVALARRSGAAVAGFEKVAEAIRRGEAALLLAASDGAPDGRGKIRRLAHGAPVAAPWTARELGAPFGRERVAHAAVAAGGVCERLLRELARLEGLKDDGGGRRDGIAGSLGEDD